MIGKISWSILNSIDFFSIDQKNPPFPLLDMGVGGEMGGGRGGGGGGGWSCSKLFSTNFPSIANSLEPLLFFYFLTTKMLTFLLCVGGGGWSKFNCLTS